MSFGPVMHRNRQTPPQWDRERSVQLFSASAVGSLATRHSRSPPPARLSFIVHCPLWALKPLQHHETLALQDSSRSTCITRKLQVNPEPLDPKIAKYSESQNPEDTIISPPGSVFIALASTRASDVEASTCHFATESR